MSSRYTVQKTVQEFSVDASTKWHVVDETGAVVRYFFTKRQGEGWVRDRQQRTGDFHVVYERTSGDNGYSEDQRWAYVVFEDDRHVITGYARTKKLAVEGAKLDIADAIAEREHEQQERDENPPAVVKNGRVESETGSWPQRKTTGRRISHER